MDGWMDVDTQMTYSSWYNGKNEWRVSCLCMMLTSKIKLNDKYVMAMT